MAIRKPVPLSLTVQEAMVILRVSESTIRRMIRGGELEASRIRGKILRIPKESLAKVRRQRDEVPFSAEPAPVVPVSSFVSAEDVAVLAAMLVH